MSVFKCKMCGGTLEVAEGMTVCECQYCGTTQTLSRIENEQTLNLMNRANHFRQQCEFDKAAEIYEKLVAQNSDAELFWSLVLCRYGIEYVDDPLTKKKIPTCRRTQYKSILEDTDYLAAMELADVMQKPVFEAEAKYIDTVQKGILEISNKEAPFDVFICYKESDENGNRTQDSVLAQELYYQLEREGFKVFFSRITLEKKLGTQYEPYIFAALNSAKVMVVVGTKPEHFNAVWVRNEWNRYLMLMQEDHSRTLIPAYKDMDPYELPVALSMFQAQDMSKLGFMQDLIHGIKKLAKTEEPKPAAQQTVVQNAANTSKEPLMKRVKLFLEYGDWSNATEYCNRVLDLEPECAEAYFYLLMAKKHLGTEQAIGQYQSEKGFAEDDDFKKAIRFADDVLKMKYVNMNRQVIYNSAEQLFQQAKTDVEFDKAKQIYTKVQGYLDAEEKMAACDQNGLQYRYDCAMQAKNQAQDEQAFLDAAEAFKKLGSYQDAEAQVQACEAQAQVCKENAEIAKENARKDGIYETAKGYADSKTIVDLEHAIADFQTIAGYRDSDAQIEACKAQIAELERKAKRKRNTVLAIMAGIVVVSIGVVIGNNIHKSGIYRSGISAREAGNYEQALEKFTSLGTYKDASEQYKETNYQYAISQWDAGQFDEAIERFTALGDYQDSEEQLVRLTVEQQIRQAKVGDVITFGRGLLKKQWYVIQTAEDSCMLLHKDGMRVMNYSETNEDVTWETSEVRKWLNEEVYNQFNETEKAYIVRNSIHTPENPDYNTDGGNDTEDYVYLLSIQEASLLSKEILTTDKQWWLRSAGMTQCYAATITLNGNLNIGGQRVHNSLDLSTSVRPVITLKIQDN